MWVARLPIEPVAALSALRTTPGIEAGEHDGQTWLRGRDLNESLQTALSKLPLLERYDELPDSVLRPTGRLVPTGRLPEISWRPIAEFAEPVLPPAALAGRTTARCAMTLIRSMIERPANLLVLPLVALVEFAATAPNVRLHACRFAVDDSGRAVVHGTPLPPVPGQRYVEEHGVTVPSGWALSPQMPASIVATTMQLDAGDVAMFAEDGSHEVIKTHQFVRLTRSAVRKSLEHQQRV